MNSLFAMTSKPVVLLLKSTTSDRADKYQEILESHNFRVKLVETINFQYRNLANLLLHINNPDDFTGFIFTSPRCVNAVKLALGENTPDVLTKWTSKAHYAVGEATVQEVSYLGLKCKGGESGNAENLGKIISNEYSSPGDNKARFLFPHGNLKMDILKKALNNAVELEEICVYDTISNPNVKDQIVEITETIDFVVFFSPSGFNASKDYLPLKEGKIKIIAIGPTTAEIIKTSGFSIHRIANQPTPQDILNCLL